MSSYLVTGGGRGLGLELVTQLAKHPDTSIVFAATRSEPSEGLQTLVTSSQGRVVHLKLPITDKAGVAAGAEDLKGKLGGKGLDVLINNAGVMPFSLDGIAAMDNLREALEVNVEAVHNTTAALLPLLQLGTRKTVLNISTTLGSIGYSENFRAAPVAAYKISKAALSMLTKQYAFEYEKDGFTFFVVSPGWLRTDMGSQDADLDVSVGAAEVVRILMESNQTTNGKFLNIHVPGWENAEGPNKYDGAEVVW